MTFLNYFMKNHWVKNILQQCTDFINYSPRMHTNLVMLRNNSIQFNEYKWIDGVLEIDWRNDAEGIILGPSSRPWSKRFHDIFSRKLVNVTMTDWSTFADLTLPIQRNLAAAATGGLPTISGLRATVWRFERVNNIHEHGPFAALHNPRAKRYFG